MTTPTGQISLDDVNIELDIAPGTQINMNAANVRGLAEVPSGAISMSNLQGKSNAQYIVATGGSIATNGDYKIHTFNSSGTFTVTSAGNPAGSDSVEYMVVSGGGGGGTGEGGPENPQRRRPGAGGAGGFREAKNPAAPFPASPLATSTLIPTPATSYPISVGGGGAGAPAHTVRGGNGTNSSFSSITSAGGGAGGGGNYPIRNGNPGGSGGGAGQDGSGGSGNSPSVSPSQGFPGGSGNAVGSGGGGATAAGGPGSSPTGGPGGAGATTSITGSSAAYAGGGGGGDGFSGAPGGTGGGGKGGGYRTDAVAGSANTGGGGGGGSGFAPTGDFKVLGKAGGSGKVVIRYKFQ